MANNENKSTLMHDAIMLFVITLIAGVLLGGVYTITKDPIAKADEKATNEAYAAVYKDAEFKADDTLTKAVESFQRMLQQVRLMMIHSHIQAKNLSRQELLLKTVHRQVMFLK